MTYAVGDWVRVLDISMLMSHKTKGKDLPQKGQMVQIVNTYECFTPKKVYVDKVFAVAHADSSFNYWDQTGKMLTVKDHLGLVLKDLGPPIKPGDTVRVLRNDVNAHSPDKDVRLEPGDTIEVDEVDTNNQTVRYWFKKDHGIKHCLPLVYVEPVGKTSFGGCQCDLYTVILVTGCRCEAGQESLKQERARL